MSRVLTSEFVQLQWHGINVGTMADYMKATKMQRFLWLDELNLKIEQHNDAAKDSDIPPHGGGRHGR